MRDAKKEREGELRPEGVLTMGQADPESKSIGNKETPKCVSSKVIVERPGFIFREEDWDYGGTIRRRQRIELQDSSTVLPITSEGKLVLEVQFRLAPKEGEHWLTEAPAGKLDMIDGKWEDPKNTAVRELKEELGYTAREIIPYPPYYTTPGKVTEKQFPFIAKGLTKGEAHLELGEVFRKVMEVTPREALEMIERGEILDLKTQNLIRGYALYLVEKNAKKNGIDMGKLLREEKSD